MYSVLSSSYPRFMFYLFLQERSGNSSFTHEALTLKYKLDNEFELLFVVSKHIYHKNESIKERLNVYVANGASCHMFLEAFYAFSSCHKA